MITIVVLVLGWQALVSIQDLPSYLLPTPQETLQASWDARDDLRVALIATFLDAVIGLGVSILIGLCSAFIITRTGILQRALLPYAVVLQTIPIISIAPLIIIWLGTGDIAIVVIAVIVSIFPIISSTTLGLLSTDHNLLNLATMYNASPWQQFLKLRLPSALPYCLEGIRIASGLSVIGVIVGEYFAGQGGPAGGLGYVITVTARNLQVPELFAATILTSVLGIVVYVTISIISHIWLHNWHESSAVREN
jgi:NitT/TauT family transport system permease protein